METTGGKLALSPNARKVLVARYLKKDQEGKVVEQPEELFRRVAGCIAASDKLYGKGEDEVRELEEVFYGMMASMEFLPNSPTLMNAGRKLGQLSACFVLPVEDSMESIFDAVKNAAIIHKSGGGTGFSFSRLRPAGDVVGSTKGISSGPVSFMTVFDTATEAVKQGGTRRGANMGMLRVDHPDIIRFVTCKDDNAKLNNFNISVALTDAFMRAVAEGRTYQLRSPRTGAVTDTLEAREVFGLIVEHAWKNGEPGIVFMDGVNRCNPTPVQGAIESTNPCGEQPLLPYESCNLGSLNLAVMLKKTEAGGSEVDWTRLREATHRAVHFLDNVIDANRYPLAKIEEMTRANRKIGLGVMGWADMLIRLGIPYNSSEAVRTAEEVMGFIQEEGRRASAALAGERGVFANFPGSVYDGRVRVRNATVTTIAPTGTLSIIAGCSSGVEPLFAVSYVRNVMEGTKLIEVNPLFEEVAKDRGFWSRELMERIAEQGSINDFEEIPEDVKRVFVTAHDVSPWEHVGMQAAFQKHVDNAVSKTVNFPSEASVQDVESVFLEAYESGCKGVTVYRDGSRDSQVLTKGKRAEKAAGMGPEAAEGGADKHLTDQGHGEDSVAGKKESASGRMKIVPRKRPRVIKGTTRQMKTGCGTIYITINEDKDGNIFELFTSMGKAGGCAASQAEAIGRLISLALRSNIDPDELIKQLKGVRCHQPMWEPGGQILSCSDAIAKAIEQFRMADAEGNGGNGRDDVEIAFIGACPECGGAVEHEGGCAVCRDCGFTRCG
ncbi:MAG: vitamin B12-dependent ribonucleotide reductase [Nitrospirota bacterium]